MDGYQDDYYLLETNGSAGVRGGDGHSHEEYSTPNWLPFAVGFSLWFVAALIIKYCFICIGNDRSGDDGTGFCGGGRISCCWFRRHRTSPSGNDDMSFDHEIAEARKEASQNTPSKPSANSSSLTVAKFQSWNGDFYIKYVDHEERGKTLSGFSRLQLTNNGGNGYGIVGMCADASGCATITEGHVSYCGDAWWVQEVGEDEERSGLRVFSWGKFDFDDNTFAGRWRSDSGSRGSFLKFEGKNVTTDIPVAVAVPGLPSQENSV